MKNNNPILLGFTLRELLRAGTGLVILLAVLGPTATADTADAAKVPPVDLGKFSPGDFADDELLVPYYLEHLHEVANSIPLEGPNRGLITLSVWRPERFNKTYNARILENHVSLAYFYCTDRPWNVYRGDPALRKRLEALLERWCDSQNEDGRFSEYGPKKWNLPATGFAILFMGRTLEFLHDGPPIDKAIHRRAIEAHHKAIRALLTRSDLFDHGTKCSNQYSSMWGGALAHLRIYVRMRSLSRWGENA